MSVSTLDQHGTCATPSAPLKRVVWSRVLGSTVEWYDFLVYGTAAELLFNKLFFPSFSPAVGTIAAFGSYGVGFVARPLGGAIFGHFGDRIGRKAMLTMTIFIMGFGTFLIGCLPTYVPLHPVLAGHLRVWQRQTPRANETDFVFPSLRARGRKPLSSSVFVADHLRPAARKAGVHIEDGQRFGLHNLRHSLSNWLVNKAKVEPKTVQGILRHAKIQTTLDLYTQEDSDETRAAQGEFLTAVGMSTTVN
jgi:hypothetical protein